jgi:hypothetical protein
MLSKDMQTKNRSGIRTEVPVDWKLSVLPTEVGPWPVTAYEKNYAFTSLLFVTYQAIKQNIVEIRFTYMASKKICSINVYDMSIFSFSCLLKPCFNFSLPGTQVIQEVVWELKDYCVNEMYCKGKLTITCCLIVCTYEFIWSDQ